MKNRILKKIPSSKSNKIRLFETQIWFQAKNVSGSSTFIFYILFNLPSKNRKSWNLWYSCLWFFWILRVRLFWQKLRLQFLIEKPRPDLLTLSTTFYGVSVLCNRFLKAQKAQIWAGANAGVNSQIHISVKSPTF